MKRLFLALFATLWAFGAWAQAIVPQVQQSAQRLDAGSTCGVGTNFNTVANTSTLTIPAVGGQYAYITYLYIGLVQNATGSLMTNVNFTSSNLNGLEWGISTTATASANPVVSAGPLAAPIKSAAPGVATTIVSPASATNTGYDIAACWYYSP